jgi:hypothetical protein
MSSYQNIFASSNCSVISGLIPPGVKKFVNSFMSGNLLQNPLSIVLSTFGEQIGGFMGKLNEIEDLDNNLKELNEKLDKVNDKLQKFQNHTDILSGVIRNPNQAYATLDQILGVMSAYNSMKDVLKDPGAQLEDNFSQAFSSLNPRIVGPFFENFAENMAEIERLLNEVSYQVDASGNKELIATASVLNELGKLAGNIGDASESIQGFIDGDEAAYIAAAAALADYALANGLVASLLSDPCFGGQVVMNMISSTQGRDALVDVASENGINVPNGPVDFSRIVGKARPMQGFGGDIGSISIDS